LPIVCVSLERAATRPARHRHQRGLAGPTFCIVWPRPLHPMITFSFKKGMKVFWRFGLAREKNGRLWSSWHTWHFWCWHQRGLKRSITRLSALAFAKVSCGTPSRAEHGGGHQRAGPSKLGLQLILWASTCSLWLRSPVVVAAAPAASAATAADLLGRLGLYFQGTGLGKASQDSRWCREGPCLTMCLRRRWLAPPPLPQCRSCRSRVNLAAMGARLLVALLFLSLGVSTQALSWRLFAGRCASS